MLNEDLICNISSINITDLLKLKKIIEDMVLLHTEKQDMIYHYNIFYYKRLYVVLYAIKERYISDEKIKYPIQFAIAEFYSEKYKKYESIYYVYKIKNRIYVLLTIRRNIVLSRIAESNESDIIINYFISDNIYAKRYGVSNIKYITNVYDVKVKEDKFDYVEDMSKIV